MVIASNQFVTQQWWEQHRKKYDLYVSSSVIREIREGDAEAAKVRLEAIVGVLSVEITPNVNDVVKALIARSVHLFMPLIENSLPSRRPFSFV